MKLGDYGLLTEANANSEKIATIWYKAPEAFSKVRELKSDVWSLGVTLLELAKGWNPFDSYSFMKTRNRIQWDDLPSLSRKKWSSHLVDFVNKCLVRDVKKRASVCELMNVGAWEWV